MVYYFFSFLLLFALPLPAISRASLHSETLPPADYVPSSSAPLLHHICGRFLLPYPISLLPPLHSLGSKLLWHSRIFIEIVVIFCLLPACLVFVIFEVCLDSLDSLRLDAFCQQGVIYIFFCLVFALHFFYFVFLLLLIKYLCLLLVCAPTEFSFLSCQGVPSIVSSEAQRFSGLSSIWFCRFVFHVEHVPHLRLTKWKLTQLQVLKTLSCPLHTHIENIKIYFKAEQMEQSFTDKINSCEGLFL